MARSRRRARAPRRLKADWVYRGVALYPGDTASDAWLDESLGLASYFMESPITWTAGTANARFLVLYDSQNRLTQLLNTFSVAGSFGTVTAVPKAARAEGRNPRILASEGQVVITPSAWALGNVMFFGARLGVFEQDPSSGQVVLNADYHMMGASASIHSQAATWANQPGWVREWYVYRTFHAERVPEYIFRYRWRGRRVLEPHQCFGLYLESDSTSVNMATRPACRTLVADEG